MHLTYGQSFENQSSIVRFLFSKFQIGTTHNKYMQGGFGDDEDNKAALTAYVVIAMLESGVDNQVWKCS